MQPGRDRMALTPGVWLPGLPRADGLGRRPHDRLDQPAATPSVVGTTLEAHILSGQRGAPGATGEFSSLLNAIALAVRIIHTRVRAAGLAGMLGYTGETNVQGEEVQKLDAFANDVLCTVLERSGRCAMVASEELEQARVLNETGKYIVCFDPLDGSSNIDVNISIGTIFCVLRAQSAGGRLARGRAPARARASSPPGYAVYGSATTLVLSTGLRRPRLHARPERRRVLPLAPEHPLPRARQHVLDQRGQLRPLGRAGEEVERVDQERGQGAAACPTATGTSGSLVADAHRTLMKGGIFAYPADKKSPGGKLRLLYEANPMAYLFEQAGGAATNGVDRILDIEPKGLHDRTPLVLGSKHDVNVVPRVHARVGASPSSGRFDWRRESRSASRALQPLHARRVGRPDVLVHLELHPDGEARPRAPTATRSRGRACRRRCSRAGSAFARASARSRMVVAHPLVVGAVGEDELDLVARRRGARGWSSGCGATRRCRGT